MYFKSFKSCLKNKKQFRISISLEMIKMSKELFFFLSPLLLDAHILHEITVDLPLWLKYNVTLKSAAWPEALCQGIYSWRDSVHIYRGKLSSSKSICPLHRCSALLEKHNYLETKIMEKPGPVQLNLSVFGEVIQIPAGPGECVFHANISNYCPYLWKQLTYLSKTQI